MRLLVDTHVFLWVVQERERLTSRIVARLTDPDTEVWLSVVSIWEARVKHDAGRLPLIGELNQAVDRFLQESDRLLPLNRAHALVSLPDPPATNDPFDRLLLAQCEVEGMALLTVDGRLTSHRLSLKD